MFSQFELMLVHLVMNCGGGKFIYRFWNSPALQGRKTAIAGVLLLAVAALKHFGVYPMTDPNVYHWALALCSSGGALAFLSKMGRFYPTLVQIEDGINGVVAAVNEAQSQLPAPVAPAPAASSGSPAPSAPKLAALTLFLCLAGLASVRADDSNAQPLTSPMPPIFAPAVILPAPTSTVQDALSISLAGVWDNFKATMFSSAQVVSMYSIRESSWKMGLTSPFYRPFLRSDGTQKVGSVTVPLYFEYGYAQPLAQAASSRGEALVGASLHLCDIPAVRALSQKILPEKDWGWMNFFTAGMSVGCDFDHLSYDVDGRPNYAKSIDYVFYTGLQVNFR